MNETIKGLDASKINAGRISADKIVAGSITCDSIGDNVLRGEAVRRLAASLDLPERLLGRPILRGHTDDCMDRGTIPLPCICGGDDPQPDPQPAPPPAPEPTPFPTEPETFRLDATMGDYRPSTI